MKKKLLRWLGQTVSVEIHDSEDSVDGVLLSVEDDCLAIQEEDGIRPVPLGRVTSAFKGER